MMRRLTTIGVAGLAALLATTPALTGCAQAVAGLYILRGPGKVKAEFELDRDRTTAILIDDPRSRLSTASIRDMIGRTADEELRRRRVVAETIDPGLARRAATGSDDRGRPLPVDQVGRRIDAEVVIHATVTHFDPLGNTRTGPTAQLHVRVMDAIEGEWLWPKDGETFPLDVGLEFDPERLSLPGNRGTARQLDERLARKVGLALAEVFFDVEITDTNRQQLGAVAG